MELIISLLIFLAGLVAGYIASYTKEKAKNLALKEDVAKLEDEKQKVLIKYTKEIEELKKSNTLDIELRKHKYQEKKEQFAKYFNLLDQYHRKSNEIFVEKFKPIFKQLMQSATDDESAENERIGLFSERVMGLFNELNEEHLKLSTETNSIRLISSEEIDVLLDRHSLMVGQSTQETTEMIKIMVSPEYLANPSILDPFKQRVESGGIEIEKLSDEIKNRMKMELNEI